MTDTLTGRIRCASCGTDLGEVTATPKPKEIDWSKVPSGTPCTLRHQKPTTKPYLFYWFLKQPDNRPCGSSSILIVDESYVIVADEREMVIHPSVKIDPEWYK